MCQPVPINGDKVWQGEDCQLVALGQPSPYPSACRRQDRIYLHWRNLVVIRRLGFEARDDARPEKKAVGTAAILKHADLVALLQLLPDAGIDLARRHLSHSNEH